MEDNTESQFRSVGKKVILNGEIVGDTVYKGFEGSIGFVRNTFARKA